MAHQSAFVGPQTKRATSPLLLQRIYSGPYPYHGLRLHVGRHLGIMGPLAVYPAISEHISGLSDLHLPC